MSFLITTGFDHDVYANRFNLIGGIAGTGRFGRGRYARFSNGGHYCSLPLVAGEEYPSFVIGFACIESSGPYTNLAHASSFIRLFGDAGQSHVDIYWTTVTGQFVIRARNGNGTVIQDSAPINLVHGVWRYYEFKVTVDDTAGVIEVKRDGTSVINASLADTRNGGATANVHRIQFGQNAENSTGALDDVYVLKNDGVGLTDYLGEVEVESLIPSGNGTYSQYVGSDGNSTDNYLLVDDNTSVNDGDYTESDIDGEKDSYIFTDLARSSPVIRAVQYSMRVRRDDTALRSIRSFIRSGVMEYTGADFPLPTSFVWEQEVHETNPTTGSAWSVSEVNGLEGGTEVRP